MLEHVEIQVSTWVEWLRLLVEALGALVIAAGVLVALAGLVRHALVRSRDGLVLVRVVFARYLMLALELQLAADILSTSVAPTWDRIGKLAAIAVIRTTLNYFLAKELRGEGGPEEGTPHQPPSGEPAQRA